jgi:hypothetical protein
MSQYKVLKKFEGLVEKKEFSDGEIVELTDERAHDISNKLPGFLELVKSGDTEVPTAKNTVAEIKAYLDSKGIAYDTKSKKADLLKIVG